MHKLVTAKGWEFYAQSFITIGDQCYDMDDLTCEQRNYVGAALNVQGLNAAHSGRLDFHAEGLPPISEVFPGLKEG